MLRLKRVTSFEDLRTSFGTIYPTFRLTCKALGLLGDDEEWIATSSRLL
jgi:hypothetical protein